MKKLFDKSEIGFAIAWIVIYVVGFGNADAISESIGMPKLITTILGLVLTLILWGFIRRNQLGEYFGLCPLKGRVRDFLFFIPLIIISSVNFWSGIVWDLPPVETVLFMLSMCFVAFLEEVIFRGLLFKGMCRDDVKTAMIVSSLTFGMGHIVNLLMGAPLFDTLLQLVYASAVGFCYTAVFFTGGSILPCILSHAVVNATSCLAPQTGNTMLLLVALIQTLLGVLYGVYLLKRHAPKAETRT